MIKQQKVNLHKKEDLYFSDVISDGDNKAAKDK